MTPGAGPWPRREPTAQPRILRAARIELDPLRRTVTRHGQQIDLSAKEFSVLHALIAAAPAALSAEDLAGPGLGRSRPVATRGDDPDLAGLA